MRSWLIILLMLISSKLFASNTQVITVAISSAPNNLNPFFSTDASSQNINRLVHRSLISINANMEYQCDACETFSSKMVGKKQVFTFKIKRDIKFQDGSSLMVDDIKKSWEYYANDKKIKSIFNKAFSSLENVNIIDSETVELVYKTFSLENLSNLTLLKLIKMKNESIVGCGNYFIKNSTPLEIEVETRLPNYPSFKFKIVKDETTLSLKLINKEIDLAVASMSPRKVTWLRSQKNILQVWERPSNNFIFMAVNHRNKLLSDLRLRKAISLLIPRDDILKYKLQNTAVLSLGMFSPSFVDMYEDGPKEEYNPEMAESLLAELGLGKNGKKLELKWIVSNNKASIEVAEVIQNYLEKASFKINLQIQEWGTYMNSYKAGKFDLLIGQWVGLTGPDMLNFVYHTKSSPPAGGNRTSYSNGKIDMILDQATVETNDKKRNELYKTAHREIKKNYASINLWHPNIVWVGSRCLKNVELTPTGSFELLPKVLKSCE